MKNNRKASAHAKALQAFNLIFTSQWMAKKIQENQKYKLFDTSALDSQKRVSSKLKVRLIAFVLAVTGLFCGAHFAQFVARETVLGWSEYMWAGGAVLLLSGSGFVLYLSREIKVGDTHREIARAWRKLLRQKEFKLLFEEYENRTLGLLDGDRGENSQTILSDMVYGSGKENSLAFRIYHDCLRYLLINLGDSIKIAEAEGRKGDFKRDRYVFGAVFNLKKILGGEIGEWRDYLGTTAQ